MSVMGGGHVEKLMAETSHMHVLCAYVPGMISPGCRSFLNRVMDEGASVRLVDVSASDYAYGRALQRAWEDAQPLLLVEHDIAPTWEQAIEMWGCEHPVCLAPYHHRDGNVVTALGMSRWKGHAYTATIEWDRRETVRSQPGVSWRDVSSVILNAIQTAGIVPHVHSEVRHEDDDG